MTDPSVVKSYVHIKIEMTVEMIPYSERLFNTGSVFLEKKFLKGTMKDRVV